MNIYKIQCYSLKSFFSFEIKSETASSMLLCGLTEAFNKSNPKHFLPTLCYKHLATECFYKNVQLLSGSADEHTSLICMIREKKH